MIAEDYVSFETAKLLKEKGFDVNTLCKYVDKLGATETWYDNYREQMLRFDLDEGELIEPSIKPKDKYAVYGDTIPAPTIQMTMKWLREEYNLFIEIQCYGCEANEKAHFEYSYVIREYLIYDNEICETVGLKHKHGKSRLNSYEAACEAAIKYCLENLI